jgi:quinol-cytochrome oxidoreductase complex cytochrome b subunit
MSDQPADNRDPRPEEKDEKFVPFFPNYLLDEVIAWYIGLAILIVLASIFPVGLEDQADPLETPAHIKPEWYFLFLYQTLKLVSRTVGVLIPGVGILLLLLIPFLDRGPSRRLRDRKLLIGIVMVILAAVVSLTVWGWLS